MVLEGELVWGPSPGFPMWPGIVLKESEWDGLPRRMDNEVILYWVKWAPAGGDVFGVAKAADCLDFVEHFGRLAPKMSGNKAARRGMAGKLTKKASLALHAALQVVNHVHSRRVVDVAKGGLGSWASQLAEAADSLKGTALVLDDEMWHSYIDAALPAVSKGPIKDDDEGAEEDSEASGQESRSPSPQPKKTKIAVKRSKAPKAAKSPKGTPKASSSKATSSKASSSKATPSPASSTASATSSVSIALAIARAEAAAKASKAAELAKPPAHLRKDAAAKAPPPKRSRPSFEEALGPLAAPLPPVPKKARKAKPAKDKAPAGAHKDEEEASKEEEEEHDEHQGPREVDEAEEAGQGLDSNLETEGEEPAANGDQDDDDDDDDGSPEANAAALDGL